MLWKQVVVGVAAVLVLIVMIQNTSPVVVRLLFWKLAMSRILLFLLILLAGFIVGYLTHSLMVKKSKRRKP
jgi:uncharacterized integral membrane protein